MFPWEDPQVTGQIPLYLSIVTMHCIFLDENKTIDLQTNDYLVSLGMTQFVLYKLFATKSDAGQQP